jgi:hypothetical protein
MARLLRVLRGADDGMSTAEYCVGLLAACGFAALLYKLLTGDWVEGLVKAVISHALNLLPL